MKRKHITGLLVLAVVIVWGGVLYRSLLGRAWSGNTSSGPAITYTKALSVDSTAWPSPSLDYPDPFLARPVRSEKRADAPTGPLTPTTDGTVQQAFQWPDIHYAGMLRHPGERAATALLRINGTDVLGKEGDHFAGITISHILPDSLIVLAPTGAQRALKVRP